MWAVRDFWAAVEQKVGAVGGPLPSEVANAGSEMEDFSEKKTTAQAGTALRVWADRFSAAVRLASSLFQN